MSRIKKILEEINWIPEMANLPETKTGIEKGIIFVSSKFDIHGSRIKYFPDGAGKNKPNVSISISDNPKIVSGDIKLVKTKILKQIYSWIVLNKEELQYFWDNGTEIQDSIEFLNKLKKI